jgi:hypothetical protein
LHISQSLDPSHPKWGPQQNGWPFTSLLTALNLQRSSQRLLHGPFKESTRDEHVSIAKLENDTSGRPSPMYSASSSPSMGDPKTIPRGKSGLRVKIVVHNWQKQYAVC